MLADRSVTFSRFDESDPPHIVVATCEHCGGEIYAGDDVSRIDDGGGFVHNDQCAEKYAAERVYDRTGVINVSGDVE